MRALLILALLASTPAVAAADGAAIYKRCAACHLPTGAGVPSAFPPFGPDFAALAKAPAGRRYIILAVLKGISGPITVGGKPYRGIMPPQTGLDDESVAAVLNHVSVTFAKVGKGVAPFTAAEVAKVRAGAGTINAAGVGALHATVGGK